MNFEIKKASVFHPRRGPTQDSWTHYPYRSDLSLRITFVDTSRFLVKVLWRLLELESFEATSNVNHITVTSRYPYISFKFNVGGRVSRLQIGFYKTSEHDQCLNYIRQLDIQVLPSVYKRLSEIGTLSQYNNTNKTILDKDKHNERELEVPDSQYTDSQYLDTQISVASNYRNSMEPTFPSQGERNLILNTLFDADLSFNHGNSSKTSITTADQANAKLLPQVNDSCNLSQLASMCDSEIIQLIRTKLKNESFVAFCHRIDKLMETLP